MGTGSTGHEQSSRGAEGRVALNYVSETPLKPRGDNGEEEGARGGVVGTERRGWVWETVGSLGGRGHRLS